MGVDDPLYRRYCLIPLQALRIEKISGYSAKTIVLVEDEDLVRRLVSRLLEKEGYRVIQATTGVEGLKIVSSQEKVDLLLTDVTLPGGMNGVELGRRALAERSDLKLICMSGSGEEKMVTDLLARAVGATAFLAKPFSPGELVKTVNGLFDTAHEPRWVANSLRAQGS
jgi:CheY-like chemotaxis protein